MSARLGLLFVAGLGFAPQEGAEAPPADRETRVLGLVETLFGAIDSAWYARASFTEARGPGAGTRLVLPRIPVVFGNSRNAVIDQGRARTLARAAFAAFGIELAVDHAVETPAGSAVLDGYDPRRKLGFELRGQPPLPGFPAAAARPEPPETGLSDGELEELEREGARIHVADLRDYPRYDQDQFTSLLAHLAGVVEFLNAATDGPDVDLSAVLFRRVQVFPLPKAAAIRAPEGAVVEDDGESLVVRASETVTLRFSFAGPGDPPPFLPAPPRPGPPEEPRSLPEPIPTAGAPTVLLLERASAEHGWPRGASARLIQDAPDGTRPVDVHGAAYALFAPSAFDAARPFALEITLEPGTHRLGRALRVGLRT